MVKLDDLIGDTDLSCGKKNVTSNVKDVKDEWPEAEAGPSETLDEAFDGESVRLFLGSEVWFDRRLATGRMKTELEKELRVRSSKYDRYVREGRDVSGMSPYIYLYREEGGRIYVPKGYIRKLIRKFHRERRRVEVYEEIPDFENIDHPWIQTPDGDVDEIAIAIADRRFGVIEGIRGTGKKIAALRYIAENEKRALIVVKRINQLWVWKGMVDAYMGAPVGIVGSGRCTWEDITVGTDRSLYKRMEDAQLKRFGIVVIDEAHLANMKIFTDIVNRMPAWAVFGLSEGKHLYGLQKVLESVVGPVLHRVSERKSIYSGAGGERKAEVKQTRWRYEYRDDYEDMISELSRDDKRNRLILADILEAAANDGRCLVVGNRVEHLERMKEQAETQTVTGRLIDHRVKSPGPVCAEFEKGKFPVLYATFPGLPDLPVTKANRLFFVTPVKFGGHIAGVLMKLFSGNKRGVVVVYDYLDEVEVLQAQYRGREKIYRELGMGIKVHEVMKPFYSAVRRGDSE